LKLSKQLKSHLFKSKMEFFMSSLTGLNPIQAFVAPFTDKSRQIVEETAIDFVSAAYKDKYVVTLGCREENSSQAHITAIQRVFNTAAEMNECVSSLLKTDLRPLIVKYTKYELVTTADTGRAAIRLTLPFSEDVENLKTYAVDLLPPKWSIEKSFKNRIGDEVVLLRHEVVQDEASQEALLKNESPDVMKKLLNFAGLSGLAVGFSEKVSKVPEDFSTDEWFKGLRTFEDRLTHFQQYTIGPDGTLSTTLPIPESGLDSSIELEEIEKWLTDPSSQREKIMKQCADVFSKTLQQARQELERFKTQKPSQESCERIDAIQKRLEEINALRQSTQKLDPSNPDLVLLDERVKLRDEMGVLQLELRKLDGTKLSERVAELESMAAEISPGAPRDEVNQTK